MKTKILLVFMICVILVSSTGVGHTQLISPSPISSQLPAEILAGLIGKYIAMMQQYEYLVSQGQNPDIALSLRISASLDVSSLGLEGQDIIDPTLLNISKMVFWINTNIFARQSNAFAVNLNGSFGNIKILGTDRTTILVSYDEGIYTSIPLNSIIDTTTGLLPIDIGNDIPMSVEELQQLTLLLLAGISSFDTEYEGLMPTPKGMAHVVKMTPIAGMTLTMWILDKTWDLCKIEFLDIKESILASINIDKIDFVASVPDFEFVVDTSSLTAIKYDDMITLLGLKVLSVAISGVPVVSDLYTSSPQVVQGQKIDIISNAFDSQDKESDLIPLFEYKSPDGEWASLDAEYVGTAPLGHWKASFLALPDEQSGLYSFRVSYTDSLGNTSASFELADAVRVIAIPPRVVSTSPVNQATDVPNSSIIAITFNQKMNEESVISSFSLVDATGQPVTGTFEWSGNTFTFKPSQLLNYSQIYVAKVLASAKAYNGASLDANRNGIAEGSPKDDLDIRFKVELYPTIALDLQRTGKDILKGDVFTAKVMAENMPELGKFSFEIKFNPAVLQVCKVENVSFANWRPRPKDIGEYDIWSPILVDNKNGKITIAVSKTRDTGISGTGMLASIMFNAVAVGETSVSFDNALLANIIGNSIQFGLRDLKVLVLNFAVYDINKDGIVNILDFVEMKADSNADVNGDKVIDILDIIASMGLERDPSIWDVNGDGIVDIQDFIIVRTQNGVSADANGDGVVDILDVVYVLSGSSASPLMEPLTNALGASFPNPCNPESWIPFKLAESSDVVIKIYNSIGQLVKTIDLGYKNSGNYASRENAAYWDGMNEYGERVPSGVYFYNIKAGNFSATKKMIVLK
ncbi:TPA: T9SS type A sorting domain-containing protein [bacterium]|nr:T9SS type A sorting domain-containing protein [bacterium]